MENLINESLLQSAGGSVFHLSSQYKLKIQNWKLLDSTMYIYSCNSLVDWSFRKSDGEVEQNDNKNIGRIYL